MFLIFPALYSMCCPLQFYTALNMTFPFRRSWSLHGFAAEAWKCISPITAHVRLNSTAFCGGLWVHLCPETFIIYSFWEHKSVFSDTRQYQNGFIECSPASLLTSQRPVTVHLFKERHWSLGGNYCFIHVFLSHSVISSLINDRCNHFLHHRQAINKLQMCSFTSVLLC